MEEEHFTFHLELAEKCSWIKYGVTCHYVDNVRPQLNELNFLIEYTIDSLTVLNLGHCELKK